MYIYFIWQTYWRTLVIFQDYFEIDAIVFDRNQALMQGMKI